MDKIFYKTAMEWECHLNCFNSGGGMERNGYVDFALPDKMFTEVSVNSRQIGSQELHMIFALGCFSLLQKQFILINQSFMLDIKMLSDMFTTTS